MWWRLCNLRLKLLSINLLCDDDDVVETVCVIMVLGMVLRHMPTTIKIAFVIIECMLVVRSLDEWYRFASYIVLTIFPVKHTSVLDRAVVKIAPHQSFLSLAV
jgi:hypothetical protein